MNKWFEKKEQSAGYYRLQFLWFVYLFLGKTAVKILLIPIVFFIYLFAKDGREASLKYKQVLNQYQRKNNLTLTKFSAYSHMLSYANMAVDKLDSFSGKSKITFDIEQNESWQVFTQHLNNNQGVFFISTHIGNVEVLPSLMNQLKTGKKRMHSFMQTSQNSIFHQFITKHSDVSHVKMHSIEDIGIGSVLEISTALEQGEMALMAGDRISAKSKRNLKANLLDKTCEYPLGVFTFAKMLKAPIFMISSTNIENDKYKLILEQIPTDATQQQMVDLFANFQQKLILKYPKQWYNFFDYFNQ